MKQMRGWVLVIGALMFALVICLPFLALAQEAAVSAAPAASADYLTVIAVAALAVSEALALMPQLKSNGILHMVILALRKMLGRPVVPVVLLTLLALSLGGCGKSLEQLRTVAHQMIDIAGKVYEDVKDNTETVKQAVTAPAEPRVEVTPPRMP